MRQSLRTAVVVRTVPPLGTARVSDIVSVQSSIK